jgi:hypothetical protein
MSLTERKRDAPSAWRVALMAWRSVRDAAGAMPSVFLTIAGVIGVALALRWMVETWWLSPSLGEVSVLPHVLKREALTLAFDCLQCVALAVVAMSVFRLILRGEVTATDDLLAERTLRLAAWMIAFRVLILILALPTAFATLLVTELGMSLAAFAAFSASFGFFAQLVAFYVWVRCGLAYVTVALDVSTGVPTRLWAAWRLSSSIQWRFIWSAAIAFLPLYVVTSASETYAALSATGPTVIIGVSWGNIAVGGVAAVIGAALGAAVLAWNYRFVTGRHHELTAETFA